MEVKRVGKPTKRRAPKACERCRVRKVRCDIALRQQPCTNCALDDVSCVDAPPRRRAIDDGIARRRRKKKASNIPDSSSTDLDPAFATDIVQLPELTSPHTMIVNPSAQAHIDEPSTGPLLPTHHLENHFPDFTSGLLKDGDVSNQTGVPSPVPSTGETMGLGCEQPVIGDILLPNFVTPIKPGRCHQYSSFLAAERAFELPPPRLRNAIITSYVHFVHPQLPLVDVHEVLLALASDGKAANVSILLLQSILLAGSAFVETEYLVEAGFQDRMDLRKQLANRVRILYDFDCETDRFILIQSLILMTSWQEKGDEVKHLRHWLGIAYNIALFIGLNKDPTNSNLSMRRKILWRRLWWSFYIRDRMLALGLRHPPIIPFDACEMPDLTTSDFDIRSTDAAVSSTFENCGLLHDLDQQQRLAEVCVAQLKLCHNVSHVLKARHKTIVPKFGCTTTRTLLSVPKSSKTNTPEIQKCAHQLSSWFHDLAMWLQYKSPPSLNFSPEQDILIFHCALLNLCYYSLVCTLHRPWPPPILRALPAGEVCSQRKSRHAANAIVSILKDLQVQEMIQFLPTSGLTFLVQAAVTHLSDSTTHIEPLRQQSRQNLESCLEFVDCLMEVHAYAFFAKSFLLAAAAKLYQDPRFSRRLASISVTGSTTQNATPSVPSLDLNTPYIDGNDLQISKTSLFSSEKDRSLMLDDNLEVATDSGSQGSMFDVFDFGLLDFDSNMPFEIENGQLDLLLA
ncbi:hypothetical protein B0A52_09825 [Exophiala mesophila]|uniref:Zn(2)-C6 fungal-type domain-containing protein n=1 Tax=Exophiala mesophila TaxID=212818 RepID=A0A438MQN6_EXOME|nr:hypothetical protein B0A52_09825 [Exophiala mesophila]